MGKQVRFKKILTILLDYDGYIKSKDIAVKLNVTPRTVFNDLNSPEFKKMLCGAVVDRVQNQGIKLIATEKQLKKISFHLYDSQYPLPDRYYFSDVESILIYFLKSKKLFVSQNELSEHLFIDTTSIYRRVEQVNKYLSNSQVSLKSKSGVGLFLEGREYDIREVFRKLFTEKINYEDPQTKNLSQYRIPDSLVQCLELVFSEDILKEVIETIDIAEINSNEIFTNYDYDMLVIKVCIQVLRILNGHTLEKLVSYDETSRDYLIALLMSSRLNRTFNFKMIESEIYNLTEEIMSTRRINYTTRQGLLDQDEIASEFINLISAGLGIDLSNDNELRINLMKHLVPAIHRLKHGIHVENPILKHVKYEYTQEYIVVMTCIGKIENMANIRFDQNELGFVCLHVVAAVNRSTNSHNIIATLICDSGLAVSSYLSSRIEHQFKDIRIQKTIYSKEVKHHDLHNDLLIINATHFEIQGISKSKLLSISPVFSVNDQSIIRNWLLNHKYESLLKIEHSIEKNTFFFKDSLNTKEEVISKYSRLLEIDQFVTSDFAQSCIEREQTLPTTIGRGIALPHGEEKFVLKSATIIIQLNKPIHWSNQLVDLVFLLAIDKSDVDDFRSLIEKINRIVTNQNTLNILKSADYGLEIKKLLFKDMKED